MLYKNIITTLKSFKHFFFNLIIYRFINICDEVLQLIDVCLRYTYVPILLYLHRVCEVLINFALYSFVIINYLNCVSHYLQLTVNYCERC